MTAVDLSDLRACVAPLPDVPAFTLTGDDVRRWTNGMFTNNTRRLTPGQGNRHCACDDRGRVQAVLDLYFIAEDRVAIVLEGMSLDAFTARYRMYLMLDDIELDDETPPVVLSLQGPASAAVLASIGLPVPEAAHAHVEVGGDPFSDPAGLRICRKDRTGLGGMDLLCGAERAQTLLQELERAGAQRSSAAELDSLRVLGGRAAWPADGTDKSMVHELRLNEECCAFDKGCYVGQEVINRIDVKGAINKRLTGLRLSAAVGVGAEVHHGGRVVGSITSRATASSGEYALGVLRKTVWEPGTTVSVVDGDRSVEAAVVELPRSS